MTGWHLPARAFDRERVIEACPVCPREQWPGTLEEVDTNGETEMWECNACGVDFDVNRQTGIFFPW
jgi:hypothetical protein